MEDGLLRRVELRLSAAEQHTTFAARSHGLVRRLQRVLHCQWRHRKECTDSSEDICRYREDVGRSKASANVAGCRRQVLG
eukprot:3252251-Pleurochrysis_carterae.AAC.2